MGPTSKDRGWRGRGRRGKGRGREGRGGERKGREWEGDAFGPRSSPPTFLRINGHAVVHNVQTEA